MESRVRKDFHPHGYLLNAFYQYYSKCKDEKQDLSQVWRTIDEDQNIMRGCLASDCCRDRSCRSLRVRLSALPMKPEASLTTQSPKTTISEQFRNMKRRLKSSTRLGLTAKKLHAEQHRMGLPILGPLRNSLGILRERQ